MWILKNVRHNVKATMELEEIPDDLVINGDHIMFLLVTGPWKQKEAKELRLQVSMIKGKSQQF